MDRHNSKIRDRGRRKRSSDTQTLKDMRQYVKANQKIKIMLRIAKLVQCRDRASNWRLEIR